MRLFIFVFTLASTISVWSQTFPSNFSREQVGGTITNPTVMAFAPDGRIFVAEQSGALRPVQQSLSGASVYVGHLATGLYFISSGSGVKQKVLINR